MPRRKFYTDPIALFRFVGQVIALADRVVDLFDEGKLTDEVLSELGEAFSEFVIVHRVAP